MKSPLIIGAGGVTSYMMPALLNSFTLSRDTILMDADILELKNLDRQVFDKKDVGDSKIKALAKKYKFNCTLVPSYLDTSHIYTNIFDRCDYILCAVDNHPARRVALALADEKNIPLIIGANEYSTSQAMYYDKSFKDCPADPRVRFPEILTDNSGSPIRCTGEALESTPQLAIANMVTASLMLQLLWRYRENGPAENHEVIEFQTTFGRNESITIGDLS